MVFIQAKNIRLIMTISMLGFFLFVMYFIYEAKKIEHIYDDMMETIKIENI